DRDRARREGPPHALRHRREERPHPRGGRPRLRSDPRARPPDRGEGATQAAPPLAFPQVARVSRDLGGTPPYETPRGGSEPRRRGPPPPGPPGRDRAGARIGWKDASPAGKARPPLF